MLQENLKKVRLELGLTVAKFSEKLEIPAMTLTHYERGDRTPSAQLFIQLDKKLNVNLNWLVSGEGEMFTTKSSKSNILKSLLRNEMLEILKEEGILK